VRRLSLISDVADRELDAIRGTVRVFERVASVTDVIEVLGAHARRGTRAEVVDLIGHSRGHGFVTLGLWQLDDTPQIAASWRQDLRPALDAIGARTIRLLGCSTAVRERGIAAMRRLELATSRQVLGTRRFVSKPDYGPEGFISEEILVGVNGPPPRRPDPVGLFASTATSVELAGLELSAGPRLRRDHSILPVNEAVASEVLAYVDGARSWVLPGLLAEPVMIVLWSQHNTIQRADILFDHEVVRVYGAYPDDEHGRLFRVHDAAALSRYLDAVIHPRTASRDRMS
jgi:hypothetical protein